MDARAGARLGAVRAGDGDEAEGVAGRQWQDIGLEFRGLEQHPFDAAGRRGIDAGGAAHGAAVRACRAPKPLPLPEGGGDRNAIPIYKFPNAQVVHHFIPAMPLRISAMRALGAYHNVFSIESFMDELAAAAGADPVEFRLKHLEDPRGRDVIDKAAQGVRMAEGPEGAAGSRLSALPLRATRIWRRIAPSPPRSKSTGRPDVRGWCARSRRSTAARWSIRTG